MITNLFSVFDPSSTIINLAWLVIPITLTNFPSNIWNVTSVYGNTVNNINKIYNSEVSFSLGNNEKGTENIVIAIFFSIAILNIVALYPQIFSATSHLTVTLPLALTFWFSLVIFGWANNTNHMLSHLAPQGTPIVLISFIVLIELTSNIIRPITLCVRLTANIIAGHMLMTLLGNFFITMPSAVIMPSLALPLTLSILESAVACIQAYVFMTLITLYVTELN